MKRTAYCGAFRESDVSKTVTAMGWVQTRRDMGGVIFLDLRDREGVLQVVCNRERLTADDFALSERLHNESVVEVTGTLCLREAETVNPLLPTGMVELRADTLRLLSDAAPLPFPIEEELAVREELRLQYRYLDLRRPTMLRQLRFRHAVVQAIEQFLNAEGFLSVETPILTKSTPEGARDYLVPSRVHPGEFYALPQSPQIFKQLLMVGGIDRYYQIARCFRDEDLRADRQPEFTQVDVELSFVEQEDVLQVMERLLRHVFSQVLGVSFPEPFPRITWQQAMDVYGSDKPDLRFDLPIVELTDLARTSGFSVFRSVADKGGVVRALNVKGGASLTRTQIEELTAKAVSFGAKGMAWIAVRPDGERYSILTKYFSSAELDALLARMEAQPGDFVLFCADSLETVRRTLGGLRLYLADLLGLRCAGYRMLFVTDFPQFEYSQEEGRFVSMHHPFTMPYEEDLPYLESDPARVRAQAYDIVLNGVELGGGSLRIHDRAVQQAMFRALGFSDAEIQDRFGFLVGAFRFGTPPHGGFALGLDRLVMLMCGAASLREVTAFPKTRDAVCPMTGAPDRVAPEQLSALGIHAEQAAEGSSPSRSGKRGTNSMREIDVDKVARLSMLRLDGREKEAMRRELGAIVAFADQLSELDTEGVPPTAHVLPMQNVFRSDEPQGSFDRAARLAGAPASRDGCLYVPKVVE